MSDDESKGGPDSAELERVRKAVSKALKRIDKQQRDAPRCRLCGQRCRQLDRAGLCSKNSAPHMAERREHAARSRRG